MFIEKVAVFFRSSGAVCAENLNVLYQINFIFLVYIFFLDMLL